MESMVLAGVIQEAGSADTSTYTSSKVQVEFLHFLHFHVH